MLRDQLIELLQPVVVRLGYELWELEYAARSGGGLLRLYVDSQQGITLEDCERVSRAVSAVMDERGARNDTPTEHEIGRMSRIVEDGLRAGALGFSTSRTILHRSVEGELVPGTGDVRYSCDETTLRQEAEGYLSVYERAG